jgi:hypothetical protein
MQGSVPPSLHRSPSCCITSLQGSNTDQPISLRFVALRIIAATTFTICQFPQQFQPMGSLSHQSKQPKELYPLLYTTVPQVVPLPSRAPIQVHIGSLKYVTPGTLAMIKESPNLQIVADVPLTLHPLAPFFFFRATTSLLDFTHSIPLSLRSISF